jgi:hypothetical protein
VVVGQGKRRKIEEEKQKYKNKKRRKIEEKKEREQEKRDREGARTRDRKSQRVELKMREPTAANLKASRSKSGADQKR